MLVDGKHMIGVELHLTDDACPIGQEAAEEASLVQHRHPARAIRSRLLPVPAAQQVEEDRHRRGLATQGDGRALVADHGTQCEGMDAQMAFPRNLHNPRSIRIGSAADRGGRRR